MQKYLEKLVEPQKLPGGFDGGADAGAATGENRGGGRWVAVSAVTGRITPSHMWRYVRPGQKERPAWVGRSVLSVLVVSTVTSPVLGWTVLLSRPRDTRFQASGKSVGRKHGSGPTRPWATCTHTRRSAR